MNLPKGPPELEPCPFERGTTSKLGQTPSGAAEPLNVDFKRQSQGGAVFLGPRALRLPPRAAPIPRSGPPGEWPASQQVCLHLPGGVGRTATFPASPMPSSSPE